MPSFPFLSRRKIRSTLYSHEMNNKIHLCWCPKSMVTLPPFAIIQFKGVWIVWPFHRTLNGVFCWWDYGNQTIWARSDNYDARSDNYDGRLGKKHAFWNKKDRLYEVLEAHMCEIFRDPVVWGMLGYCHKNKRIIIPQNSHHRARNSTIWQSSVYSRDSIFHTCNILFWPIFQVTQRHIYLSWTQSKNSSASGLGCGAESCYLGHNS